MDCVLLEDVFDALLARRRGRRMGLVDAVAVLAIAAGILMAALVCGCQSDQPATQPAPADDFGCTNGQSDLYKQWGVYWGDLHSHTVYSDDAATADPLPGPPSSALAWAADPSRGDLDFCAITDHAEVLTAAEWDSTLAQFRSFHQGDFVPFLGFEYTNSGWTPGHGHKCVIFRDLEHVPAAPLGCTAYPDPPALWQALDASPAAGRYMTIPHHPAKDADYGANMSTDWGQAYVNAAVQPLAEI